MADPSKRPTVEEVVEQIREILDEVSSDGGDLNDIPLYAALRQLFAAHNRADELLWTFEVAIAEKRIGKMPSTTVLLHPHARELDAHINRIAALVREGQGPDAERSYEESRNSLLDDIELREDIPDLLKNAQTLRELRVTLEFAARLERAEFSTPNPPSTALSMVMLFREEFSTLRHRIFGQTAFGSPEWIALQSWFVKHDEDVLYRNIHRISQIRRALAERGGTESEETSWRNFVKREFADPSTIFAMEAAKKAYVLMTGKQDTPSSKVATPEKSKRRGRPPRR